MREMGVTEDEIPRSRDKMLTEHTEAFYSLVKRHPVKPIIGFTYRSLQTGFNGFWKLTTRK